MDHTPGDGLLARWLITPLMFVLFTYAPRGALYDAFNDFLLLEWCNFIITLTHFADFLVYVRLRISQGGYASL